MKTQGNSTERILAIDALRGFDMFWIAGPELGHWLLKSLLVLLIGVLPPWLEYQLDHPDWLGFSAWDMIMPLFLFIVGASMPFALGRRLQAPNGRRDIYLRAIRRIAILWLLGMITQGHLLEFRFDHLELYCNTLQSIAAGYLIATIAMVELRSVRSHVLLFVGLLLSYWCIMSWIAPPGGQAGDYTPDGNLAQWIDHALLGRFQHEGTHYTWILSTLGFGATVMLGVLAGQLLMSTLSASRKLKLLIAGGLVCLLTGWLMGYAMPIIKHLWTSSMVLWAGGWSLLLLALFYGVIDLLGWRRWSFFFVVIGANAIVAYMVQPIFDLEHIGRRIFGGLSANFGMAGDFVLALLTYALLWGGLYYLYIKRIFIKV